MLSSIRHGLLALLFPGECPGCGARTERTPACDQCAATFKDAGSTVLSAERPCRTEAPIALWVFEEHTPVQKIMHQIKYGNRPWIGTEVGVLLGRKMLGRIEPDPDQGNPVKVLPVPLHSGRSFERGYNQSEWIAAGVSRETGFELLTDSLVRTRPTRSQTTLTREERVSNVSGVFDVRSKDVEGADIILVDDTLTTGATLFACAEVLVEAGAVRVHPGAVASAPLRAALEPEVSIPVIA